VSEVEVICSDPLEHCRRVETRPADIEGHQLPTWQAVVERHHDSWDRPHVVADTVLLGVDDLTRPGGCNAAKRDAP
jgi:hypothetical protein